jgi:hypothetical protein
MNNDRPTLIHNGVGIADMYQPGELEKEVNQTSIGALQYQKNITYFAASKDSASNGKQHDNPIQTASKSLAKPC